MFLQLLTETDMFLITSIFIMPKLFKFFLNTFFFHFPLFAYQIPPQNYARKTNDLARKYTAYENYWKTHQRALLAVSTFRTPIAVAMHIQPTAAAACHNNVSIGWKPSYVQQRVK